MRLDPHPNPPPQAGEGAHLVTWQTVSQLRRVDHHDARYVAAGNACSKRRLLPLPLAGRAIAFGQGA
jgi:hypothetical protein